MHFVYGYFKFILGERYESITNYLIDLHRYFNL